VIVHVVAAILRRNGWILITQRPADVHLGGLWEFPGGKVEPDESLMAALVREIREEIGVDIRVDDEYFHIEHHYEARSVHLHFYNCTIMAGEPAPLHVADFRWVLPAELDQFNFPDADRELILRLRANSIPARDH
jgi:mutator protein MutT